MEQKNYLVTGGAGFIGGHLVKALLDKGHYVASLDNRKQPFRKNKKLKMIGADITNPEQLAAAFNSNKTFDAVFHLAAIPRVQYSILNPQETHETNLTGTLNLLEQARQSKVKRFVFASSSSIYGDQPTLPLVETMPPNPMSPYAFQKLGSEFYGKTYNLNHGLETILLRYFNVYGPNQDPEVGYACLIPRFISRFIKEEEAIINGDGEQTRDFTYVSDVVEATILAGETKNEKCYGQAINIGAGQNHSVNKVTEIIRSGFASSKVSNGPAVIEPRATLAEISKAKELLGWTPKTDLREGLEETVDWFRKKLSSKAR